MVYVTIICLAALFLSAPLLVFSGNKIHARPMRLLLAITLTYIFLNLTLHSYRSARWEVYQACQSQFADGFVQHHPECGKPNIADGASIVFYALLGWIPAAGYVGLWELVRRIRYRKAIKESKHLKYKILFSNGVILFIIPLFAYILLFAYVITAALYHLHIKPFIVRLF